MIHIYLFIFILLIIFIVVFTFIFGKKNFSKSYTSKKLSEKNLLKDSSFEDDKNIREFQEKSGNTDIILSPNIGLGKNWGPVQNIDNHSEYNLRNLKSEMYPPYSDYDGYESVFLPDSYKYNLNQSSINKNIIEGFNADKKNTFTNMEVPTDYGTVENPSFKISKNINGKDVVIESSGRTLWNPNFGPIWSGRWIYCGTVDSYKATLDINKVKFLTIKVDATGSGIVEDEYLNYKMDVINAGSNILTGIIPSGTYSGYRAKLELIETSLAYKDPSNPFPVKMRYYIEMGKKVLNLSSGNVYNMEGYSTKFIGDRLILSNFLEASGIQTDPKLAFSEQALEKMNQIIKDQVNISNTLKIAKKYIEIKTHKLLYKASVAGWNATAFHKLCDNKGATITIATLQDGRIIGAYSPVSWGEKNGEYINNAEAFLFDNDKKYTSAEGSWGKGNYTIYQLNTYGPTFGGGHDFLTLTSWSPMSLSNNAFTFINNGKGPLGVNKQSYNTYSIKELEVFSVTVDKTKNQARLMLKVEGLPDVPSNCEPGDYKCQGKDVCENVTGTTCVHQDYDCLTGTKGSWYPTGTPGSSTFNFAYQYDKNNKTFAGYGNICACDRSYMTKYGLASNNTYCGVGNWTPQ